MKEHSKEKRKVSTNGTKNWRINWKYEIKSKKVDSQKEKKKFPAQKNQRREAFEIWRQTKKEKRKND